MSKLSQHIKASNEVDRIWAERLGISRSHLNMLKNDTAQPSKKLMQKIEQVTAGAVPVLSWFEQGDAAQ